ncbi:MAG TPA: FAD-dependent monooxygenase [Paracoccaceae bacterium]|nr:FAD-dependent monooxygenase [Paracoccaceae bacterium]
MEQVEILIAGGGVAGLAAAARLGADGHEVMVVDPAPAVLPETRADLRTAALLQPAIRTLERAGAWERVKASGAPIRSMRLIDAGGRERRPRVTADFTGYEAGHEFFGWNIPNRAARETLLAHLGSMPNVLLCHGMAVTDYVPRLDAAFCRLSDGSTVRAKLVIAADGRNSTLRQLVGIKARRWSYGQKALISAVTHPNPHHGGATEIYRTGGPLVLVPMPDHEGQPRSSIVWLMPGPEAVRLHGLDAGALGTELTAATMGLYGPLRITMERAIWPIIGQAAQRLVAERLVLIAEAAHVVPPIGAQGLNMSLADIESLATLIEGKPDPGERAALDAHQRRQLPEMLARIAGIDALNRAARTEFQPFRDIRAAGIAAISRIPPLRRLAMRAGMGD